MLRNSLYIYHDFDEASQAFLTPWAQKHLRQSVPLSTKAAVVVPTRAVAAFIKQHFLSAGVPLLGVSFVTPESLRIRLLMQLKDAQKSPKLVSKETIHLIIQSIAERDDRHHLNSAIAREPELFSNLYNALASTVRGTKALASSPLKGCARAFERQLVAANLCTAQQADHCILKNRKTISPVFEVVLFYGFTPVHWPLYALLKATVDASRHVAFAIRHSTGSRADEAWIGTWEECLGPALSVPGTIDNPRPFEPLARSIESTATEELPPDSPRATILIGAHLKIEAEAVCLQTLSFLSHPKCTRLGIIFAAASPLAREVAAQLTQMGVPHHAVVGYQPSPTHHLFNAWAHFQHATSRDAFCDFIDALRAHGLISARRAAFLFQSLGTAFVDVRTDDLTVLSAKQPSIIRDVPGAALLPPNGSLNDFATYTRTALHQLGSIQAAELLDTHIHRLSSLHSLPLSRDSFLCWLRSILQKTVHTPSPLGENPFARVQLLTAQDAVVQSWSHLILAGFNHGQWPTDLIDSPLMPDTAIEGLNPLMLRQGSQGEGHLIAPFGYLLSTQEIRAQTLTNFVHLIENVRCDLAVTASCADGRDLSRPAGVSDLLARLHKAQDSGPLTLQRLSTYVAATEQWLEAAHYKKDVHSSKPTVAATVHAWRARRTREQPFGEFEYAFREPPPGGLTLSCKAWESILQRPAAAWYTHVLGIRPRFRRGPAAQADSALARGTWVHDWLRLPSSRDGLSPKPHNTEWEQRVIQRAQRLRSEVERAYTASGRHLPERWSIEWQQALWCARTLLAAIPEHDDWPFAASEYVLSHDAFRHDGLSSTFRLPLFPLPGRIDLLLATTADPYSNSGYACPSQSAFWIIDYKTGAHSDPLNTTHLVQGKGLQLALYAIALSRNGCKNIAISLLGVDAEAQLTPQMRFTDLSQLTDFWDGLNAIHQSGVLGQGLSSHFGAAAVDYPIAVLPIEPAILREKWRRTHPHLSVPKEA